MFGIGAPNRELRGFARIGTELDRVQGSRRGILWSVLRLSMAGEDSQAGDYKDGEVLHRRFAKFAAEPMQR